MGALATECLVGGTQVSQCKQNMCEMVGQTEVCTECKTAGHVPIDGTCTNVNSDITAAGCQDNSGGAPSSPAKCTKCAKAGYFLFKGGCYKVGKAPGNLICADETGTNSNPGCKVCADGYFKDASADSTLTTDPCAACGDNNCVKCKQATTENQCTQCAEGYFVAKDTAEGPCISCNADSPTNNYKGIAGCAKCTKPASAGAATCTECQTDKYLKTEITGDTPTTSCVSAEQCVDTYFPILVGKIKTCVSCGDATNGVDGCEKCTTPAQGKTKPTCTKCKDPKYLKTASDGATTCVAKGDCKDDYFPKEGNTNENKCLSCSDETDGVPNCAKCTLSSRATKPTCSECGSGYKLEGETCVSTGGVNLSPGAIAGISVAAVVVVGGLVGFLCWWFICRGKA